MHFAEWTETLSNSSRQTGYASSECSVPMLRVRKLKLPRSQNPETRNEILALQAAENYAELSVRLSTRVAFGTAGLRAEMKAGNAFLNELVIIQTAQGLLKYALEVQPAAREMGIVIGHDHRHRSKRFAELCAEVARRAGVKVYLFQGLVHTPLVVSVHSTSSRVDCSSFDLAFRNFET